MRRRNLDSAREGWTGKRCVLYILPFHNRHEQISEEKLGEKQMRRSLNLPPKSTPLI